MTALCPYDIGVELLLARRHIALGSCMPCAHRVANQACGLNDCAACGLNDCARTARTPRRSSPRIGGDGGGGRARKGHSLSLSHHIGERLDAQKERPGAATAGNRWSEPPRCVSQHIFCIAGSHLRPSLSLSERLSFCVSVACAAPACLSGCDFQVQWLAARGMRSGGSTTGGCATTRWCTLLCTELVLSRMNAVS